MYNFSVVVDAGHGGSDSGATANGVLEKDLNLEIARYMYERFQQEGVPVTLIRSTDETISPTERVRRILDAYGDNPNVIVISNHINAAGTDTVGAEGAEVIYALRNNDQLAKNILQALGNAGQITRTYFQRRLPSNTAKDYYFIHRDTGRTQPVIVEYGFIDNPEDLARIQNNYKRYVDAVVEAVIATETGNSIVPSPGEENTYVVKSGDSLWKIANQYGTTVNAIRNLNNLTSDVLTVGQVLQIPGTNSGSTANTYTVQSGDSLWKIANRYGITVNAIKQENNLTSDELTVGQRLTIPSSSVNIPSTGNTYVVKSGDSLWNIANRYHTTVDAIKVLNGLTSNSLSIGQVLQIPSSSVNTPSTGNTYVVKSGDSLWKIANQYGTTVDAIKQASGIISNNLTVGQILTIPN